MPFTNSKSLTKNVTPFDYYEGIGRVESYDIIGKELYDKIVETFETNTIKVTSSFFSNIPDNSDMFKQGFNILDVIWGSDESVHIKYCIGKKNLIINKNNNSVQNQDEPIYFHCYNTESKYLRLYCEPNMDYGF